MTQPATPLHHVPLPDRLGVDRGVWDEYVRRTRDDLQAWVLASEPHDEQVIRELCARWILREGLVLTYTQWVEMFRHVGYAELGWNEARTHLTEISYDPPARSEFPLRLWRAAEPDYRNGMSWTAHHEFALEYFLRALRRGVQTRLWYVDVPDSSHLLAWFGRNADVGGEVLVDCSRLRVRPATRRVVDEARQSKPARAR